MIFFHPPTTMIPPNCKFFTPLGDSFSKNGFHYEQILRDGNWAIFKQRLRPGVGELAYEVIRIKVAPEWIVGGKVIPAHEVGPSNEEFGKFGWSYPTLERAKVKFYEMVEKRGKK